MNLDADSSTVKLARQFYRVQQNIPASPKETKNRQGVQESGYLEV